MSGDDVSQTWPVNDIVYTAIIGLVMIAAFLEWFLWVAAFLYCLWKVFRKAEHWTVNVLAVVIAIAFTALRCVFLPVMLVTLPLPSQISQYWPEEMVTFLRWFGFWTFACLLTVPWLLCVYQVVTQQFGRTRRIKHLLDEASAPKVVIVMPCYKEEPDVLITAINSVVDCDYPPACVHVFVSFDGDQQDDLYLSTIERLGVPLTLKSYPQHVDVAYRSARVTVSRFPHGGKRNCQKLTFRLIDRVYQEYLMRNDNLFILFIDSDCILDRVCLQNFVYDMELSPGNRRNMLAMTGIITSTTKRHSVITLLQDMEYIHGQLFERTVESGCGAVTCLPGALTMLRFSAFRRMAKYYFADQTEQCEDLFDFAKGHLGEDRWLTHLFMIGAKSRYQIQMCTSAFCKTEAVQTMGSLVKQRRRWFLGFITNEACMLTDWRLWRRYPLLVAVRFATNTIRTTALLFFVMVLALMTSARTIGDLPVGFIGVSLGLNWLLMLYFGWRLRRFKLWLYPLMFVLNPFLNWYYMVYGIFTAGQRTWGGPRADAAAADSETTAHEAIEQAELRGDDLQVVPESFIPAAAARRGSSSRATSGGRRLGRSGSVLQPPAQVEGMFSAPERAGDGWFPYHHPDDSEDSSVGVAPPSSSSSPSPLPGSGVPRRQESAAPVLALAPRGSVGNFSFEEMSGSSSARGAIISSGPSGPTPQGIMSDEDRRKYQMAHAGLWHGRFAPEQQQRRPIHGTVFEFDEPHTQPRQEQQGFAETVESLLGSGPGPLSSSSSGPRVFERGERSFGYAPVRPRPSWRRVTSSSEQPLLDESAGNPSGRFGRGPHGRESMAESSMGEDDEEEEACS